MMPTDGEWLPESGMSVINDAARAARQVAKHFEDDLHRRLEDIGIADDAYVLEITACGSAEGDDFAYRSDCVYLEQMTSFTGGFGTGGRIMRALLELADERGLTVVIEAASQKFDERNPWWRERLTPEQISAQAFRLTCLSQEELEAWYGRIGFTAVADGAVLMQRPPAKPVPAPGR
jgi:hypothetical protein